MLLAVAVAWWSFPGSTPVPEGRPLAAATPTPRRVPVPVDPGLGMERAVAEAPGAEAPEAEPPPIRDTGTVVLELVMPVGEGCEGLAENADRLDKLLTEVKTANGAKRRGILRQIGPLMQSVEVEGCDPVPDYRPEVTTILCDEVRERPDDMELLLVTGFAQVQCE